MRTFLWGYDFSLLFSGVGQCYHVALFIPAAFLLLFHVVYSFPHEGDFTVSPSTFGIGKLPGALLSILYLYVSVHISLYDIT